MKKSDIGKLKYQRHYKNKVEGSIFLQQYDGCLLIANVVPAASISQEQHDKNMEAIVNAVNKAGTFKNYQGNHEPI